MIKKTTYGFLSALLGVAIAMAIGIGVLAWQLAQGPVPLNFATTAFEDRLADSFEGAANADIGGLTLTWNTEHQYPLLIAENVTLQNEKGERIASVARMEIGLAIPSLMIGRLRFHTLSINSLYLAAYVARDGSLSLSSETESAPPTENKDAPSLDEWLTENRNSWWFFFRSLQATDSQIVLIDDNSKQHLTIVVPSITAKRSRKGLSASMQAFLSRTSEREEMEASTFLQGDALYDAKAEQTNGTLRFQNTRMNNLAIILGPLIRQLGADFAPLEQFDVPLNGALDLALDNKLDLRRASLQLRGEAGVINTPDYYDTPIPVQNLLLSADYDGATKIANLHDFYGEIKEEDGSAIPFRIKGKLLKDQSINLNISLERISTERLIHYWPKGAAQGAYDWVSENVHAGSITKAWLGLRGNLVDQEIVLADVEGMFDVEGADIHYFGDYPNIKQVRGSASFNENSFNISIISAEVHDIQITESQLIITGLDEEWQEMDINATLRGPLKTALQILDTAPYRFASNFGLDPNTADGNAAIRLRFGFPLIKALDDIDVRFSGAGHFINVALDNVIAGQNLSQGNAKMELDGDGATLTGEGRLGTAPVEFKWRENFGDISPRTAMDFKAAVDDAMRRALSIPGEKWFSGNVLAEGTYTANSKNAADLALNLNLEPTNILIEDLNYVKAPGRPASARMQIALKDNKVASVRDIVADAPNLRLRGDAVLDAKSSIPAQLTLNSLEIGDTKGSLTITSPAAGSRNITFKGSRFDARGLLAPPKDKKNKPPAGEPSLFDQLDVALDLGFDEILLPKGQRLRNAGGGMRYSRTMWTFFDLGAALSPSGFLKMLWQPAGAGQRLNIYSDNAGAVLAGLGLTDTVRGGALSITGQGTGKLEPWIAEGQASITDFKVVDAPVLARLLALTSPGGLIDTLSGEGLSFGRLKTNYQFGEKRIVLKEGRTSGPAIGLSFNGTVDRENDTLDMRGTIVPLYGINSALGNIPLIGNLLVGTKGDGVFSATYTIDGPTSDPDVSVNPLAAFAPGFLRELLFEGEPD